VNSSGEAEKLPYFNFSPLFEKILSDAIRLLILLGPYGKIRILFYFVR